VLTAVWGCVSFTDITGIREHPAVKGNRYCTAGSLFVVQRPMSVSTYSSTAGHGVDPAFYPQGLTNWSPSVWKQMQVMGYLRPGDTVKVERVYWIRHFDVGNHLEIRARVLSGSLKGTLVDIEYAQDDKYLIAAEGDEGTDVLTKDKSGR